MPFAGWCEGRGLSGLPAVRPVHVAAYIEELQGELSAPSVKQHLAGLRDRALIATIIYTFARIGAVLKMNVRDYFSQGRRGWMRLHDNRGRSMKRPATTSWEAYMDEYPAALGFAEDKDGPLWRTTGRKTGTPQRLTQPDAYLNRAARETGGHPNENRQSFHACYRPDRLPENGGKLEKAQEMANHSSSRTTKPYERRNDELTLDEYEKVGI